MYFYKKSTIYRADDQPYLKRLTLFACKFFTIKIHKILLSDFECLHDHPWTFVTLLLRGGYVEHTMKGSRVYGAGSVLYRPAAFAHRLEIHQPVTSLVITFKKFRPWGFYTPRGWVFWRTYQDVGSCE